MSNNETPRSITLEEFLDLSKADIAYIDTKVALKKSIKKFRIEAGITQSDLADLLDSSQSRVAKMEGGDTSVSIDLMLKALFALELSRNDIAAIISPEIDAKIVLEVEQQVNKWRKNFAKRLDHLEWTIHQIAAQPKRPKTVGNPKVISLKQDQPLPLWQVQ